MYFTMDIKMLWVWNVHVVSNRWLIGVPFKEKVSHPPAPRGDASEGASVLCTGTEEVARVNLLDLTFGHSAN